VAGIPDWRTRPDRYLSLQADRAKGLRLAEKAATADLIGTAEFYYDITEDVDGPRRRIYMHHIRQAERRGAEILDELAARLAGGLRPGMRVLEIGAGTGGLAAAAARRGLDVTAGDIAFRWTVVAARRLADAGLTVPLISFAAEAIPFADGQFDAVIANGVIEHCQDHAAVAAEARRVLRPGGVFLIVSPNRFAPTPEPHVGVWGVGFLPRAWMDAYVRAVRGIPYRWLRVFSAGELRRLLTRVGFASVSVRAAPIPPSRAEDFGPAVRRFVPWYNRLAADRLTGPLLTPVGPLLWAEAVAPGDGHSAYRGPVGL
jgi:ubiquinone/menaquinone biosynthesis C-methylase UbiE